MKKDSYKHGGGAQRVIVYTCGTSSHPCRWVEGQSIDGDIHGGALWQGYKSKSESVHSL
jgi:hypothetical protein